MQKKVLKNNNTKNSFFVTNAWLQQTPTASNCYSLQYDCVICLFLPESCDMPSLPYPFQIHPGLQFPQGHIFIDFEIMAPTFVVFCEVHSDLNDMGPMAYWSFVSAKNSQNCQYRTWTRSKYNFLRDTKDIKEFTKADPAEVFFQNIPYLPTWSRATTITRENAMCHSLGKAVFRLFAVLVSQVVVNSSKIQPTLFALWIAPLE